MSIGKALAIVYLQKKKEYSGIIGFTLKNSPSTDVLEKVIERQKNNNSTPMPLKTQSRKIFLHLKSTWGIMSK